MAGGACPCAHNASRGPRTPTLRPLLQVTPKARRQKVSVAGHCSIARHGRLPQAAAASHVKAGRQQVLLVHVGHA